jgi:membrane-bound metal-dependent hydrolase YbcI (DUF457 family)
MVAGHFGLAAAVKSRVPTAPLWALMVATQWLDIIFVPLFLLGIETIDPTDTANPNAYGGGVIHAVYTHSLVGALALSALLGGLAWLRWGRRVGVTIGLVAFSHWILDLLVHRPDLPILPGDRGNLPLLVFGLWQVPVAAGLVELALVVVGAVLYYRAATSLPAVAGLENATQRWRRLVASAVVSGLLGLSFLTTILGLP